MLNECKNVDFYNDTASISPFSTETAIKTIGDGRNIVLIFGGAKGKGDYTSLYNSFSKNVHTVILLSGSGTLKERLVISKLHDVQICSALSIDEAVHMALENAKKGDKVLFSPGFDAIGIDGSRKERGERFVKAVRGI